MSGRARKNGERAKLDAYYTDDRVAQAVIDEVIPHILMAEAAPLRVLEPHVGGGAWVRALRRLRSPNITITAMDLNPEAAGLALADHAMPGVDFLELAKGWSSNDVPWDLVVGNPPFSVNGTVVAHHHLEAAKTVGRWVIMLTRVGLYTAARRRDWVRSCQPCLTYDLAPRPSFTGRGTDSAEYRVAVFGPYKPTSSRHQVLWWKE